MKQTEIELLTKLFDTKSEDIQTMINMAMEDVRRTIAVASANTDGQLYNLDKTIKEHNERLKKVECEQIQHKKVINVIKKVGKYWYITAAVIILLILILIPIVEFLGIRGIISIFK